MQTLYIDVYFLVNFVIDTLSLFFGLRLSRGTPRLWRCVFSGVLLALASVMCVLVKMPSVVFFVFFFGSLLGICALTCCGDGRRIYWRLVLWFLLLESLIGGAVYSLYIQLDKIVINNGIATNNEAENRVFLYIAVALLLGVGVVRLLYVLFSGGGRMHTMRLEVSICGKVGSLLCLWDSGNFLCDPVSTYPVVLVKMRALAHLLSEDFLCERYEHLSEPYRRALRLIPVHGVSGVRILQGILVRDAVLTDGKIKAKRTLVVAMDKEEGDFGGCDGLLPGGVLDI